MKLTNRKGLPDSIVQAVLNDPYKGGGDISVTKLITPPYQRQLLIKHADELEEDVADRIYSLIGQIGHSIVERIPLTDETTSVREERLYKDVPIKLSDGTFATKRVSGQFDLIESHKLMDFKFTSTYAMEGKIEWEHQLNLLRALCVQRYAETKDKRYIITEAAIVAVFRDWSRNKAKSMSDYPDAQVEVIPVKLWPVKQAFEFLQYRTELHFATNPEPCTAEEMWEKPAVFAVMKKGGKRAVKLHPIKADAEAHARNLGDGATVVDRPAERTRCASYCSARDFCPSWKAFAGDVAF